MTMMWRMWAVYAVEDNTLVSMHLTEAQCVNAAIEASMDNNAILAWTHVLVTQEDDPRELGVVHDHWPDMGATPQ